MESNMQYANNWNHPDDMNWAAFDAGIGSRATEAEEALEHYRELVIRVAEDAYREFPSDSFADARERWTRIRRDGTCKAFDRLSPDIDFTAADRAKLTDALDRAMDADAENEKSALMQSLGEYFDIMEAAMERGRA
jgi:hypothetical protein